MSAISTFLEKHLGDIAELRSGIGFPLDLQGCTSQKYPFAKVGDISAVARAGNTVISDARHAISEEDLEVLRATPFPAGTIAFAKIGEAISQNFRVVTTCPMLLDNNVMGVIPDSRQVDTRYLLRYLQSIDFYRLTGKTAVPAIRKSVLEKVKIPLPPLPEQRRIAAILDKADAVRRKRQQTLDLADNFLRSAFLDLFGDCHRPPISIGEPRFGDATNFVAISDVARLATGHTPDRKNHTYWGGEIPWISLTDIRDLDGTTATETIQNVTEAGIANSSSVKLPPGTVCFSRTASVGFATVMGREMCTSQDFVNWVCGDQLDPVYLMWALRQSRPYLLSKSSGSTHKTIYYRHAEQFQVFLPPLNLQSHFVAIVKSVEHQQARQQAHLADLGTLFASVQQRAFRGEL